jgi:hypothetical protein
VENNPILLVDPSGFGGTAGCGALTNGISLDGGVLSGARPGSSCVGGAAGGGSTLLAVLALIFGKELGEQIAEQIQALLDSEEAGNYEIHWGKQGKHILGHNNYEKGRSILTHPDPQDLLDRGAHTGTQIGSIPVGQAGSKELVDFGEEIGLTDDSGQMVPTNHGVIHYAADGTAHIVPTRSNGEGGGEEE